MSPPTYSCRRHAVADTESGIQSSTLGSRWPPPKVACATFGTIPDPPTVPGSGIPGSRDRVREPGSRDPKNTPLSDPRFGGPKRVPGGPPKIPPPPTPRLGGVRGGFSGVPAGPPKIPPRTPKIPPPGQGYGEGAKMPILAILAQNGHFGPKWPKWPKMAISGPGTPKNAKFGSLNQRLIKMQSLTISIRKMGASCIFFSRILQNPGRVIFRGPHRGKNAFFPKFRKNGHFGRFGPISEKMPFFPPSRTPAQGGYFWGSWGVFLGVRPGPRKTPPDTPQPGGGLGGYFWGVRRDPGNTPQPGGRAGGYFWGFPGPVPVPGSGTRFPGSRNPGSRIPGSGNPGSGATRMVSGCRQVVTGWSPGRPDTIRMSSGRRHVDHKCVGTPTWTST